MIEKKRSQHFVAFVFTIRAVSRGNIQPNSCYCYLSNDNDGEAIGALFPIVIFAT